jgi:protein O-GlcNAc transferase
MALLRALFGRKPAPAVPAEAPSRTAAEWQDAGRAAIAADDLQEAERCFREATAADAADPLARVNLGFVSWRQARHDEAQTLLMQALALARPGDAFAHDAHYLLAQIHREGGASEVALTHLRAASAARTDFAEAVEDEANLLLELGRNEEALAAAARLGQLRPGPAAKLAEARALHALARHAEALAAIDAVLAAEPDNGAAASGRANVLLALGRPAEALQAFEGLLARSGPDAAGLNNVAAALMALGRFGEARERVAEALALQPAYQPALVNRIHALDGLLRSGPDAPLHASLAAAYREVGDYATALDHADQAIALAPDLGSGHLERGRVLAQLERNEEALDACSRAAELQPDADAFGALAVLLARLRLSEEALEVSARAVAANPGDLTLRSHELFFANFSEAMRAEALFERHREFGRLLEARVPPTYQGHWLGSRESGRRLRIGFVSPDLWNHPVVVFLLPLLARIDPARLEVVCYSTGWRSDDMTARIRAMVPGWVDAATLTDPQLAARIHHDAIDVLVDLAGHSGTPRLAVFAERPAPIQMTWLGYLNTTGLSRMDYRLCDERTDPPGTQHLNTETLLHFAPSQWCYRPLVALEPAAEAPCRRNGFVTFGSFNNARKVTHAMCGRWAQILARCPGSRLLVADLTSPRKRQSILDAFARHGVSGDRLEPLPRADIAGYLRLYDRVDISLDTHPYGGGTTTIDSLWMGVPVVAATGELPVARSASSILQLLGLGDWAAPTIEGYVECAVRHAQDPAAIQQLRTSLRARVERSPLMDEPAFARNFEAAVRQCWQRFCAAA